ncbi:MAG: ATP-binding protein [Thermoanaerobaculia bacterium]
MLERSRHLTELEALLRQYPVVALLGARQVGKTTLAAQVAQRFDGPVTRFDLERPRDLGLLEDAELTLDPLRGLVVLDEVQHRPDLFPLLRVLADRPQRPARFLVLGSASPELLRQGSESLAGRIAFHELRGFSLGEVGPEHLDRLWLRGGFPLSYLAPSHATSFRWRQDFLRAFLERTLPEFGVQTPAPTMRRFWTMLAHYHAQTWNGAELARALGVSQPTVRRYLDLLTAAFVVRQLPPWHENLSKRQVKSPKVYIADAGLLHGLLDLELREQLSRHPKVGASWEGFVMEEIIGRLRARPEQCYFWATHTGAELDLLVYSRGRRFGFEFKRTVAPRLTPSMRIAMEDLRLDHLDVLHAGDHTFPMAQNIRAVAAHRLLEDIEPLD